MRVVLYCAQCGREMAVSIKGGFKDMPAPRQPYSEDMALYVAPCYECTDVHHQVSEVIRAAMKSLDKKQETVGE